MHRVARVLCGLELSVAAKTAQASQARAKSRSLAASPGAQAPFSLVKLECVVDQCLSRDVPAIGDDKM